METLYCKTCRFLALNPPVCQLTGWQVNPEEGHCHNHNEHPIICEKCGRIALTPQIISEGEKAHALCPNCAENLNSCIFCKNATQCLFETDPSPLPKIIQKQIRQGPMISVTTIKNPDRIVITCQKGCKCFDIEKGCLRENNYCKEIDYVYE